MIRLTLTLAAIGGEFGARIRFTVVRRITVGSFGFGPWVRVAEIWISGGGAPIGVAVFTLMIWWLGACGGSKIGLGCKYGCAGNEPNAYNKKRLITICLRKLSNQVRNVCENA